MRHRRDRLGPLEPVLKSDRYQGAINVGNSPGAAPPSARTTLTIVGSYEGVDNTFRSARSLAFGPSGILFVTSQSGGSFGRGGLHTFDISDPTNPTVLNVYTDDTFMRNPWACALTGTTLVVTSADNNRITTIDVSTPASPSTLGSLTDAVNLDRARGVQIVGTTAFVPAWDTDRLTAVDISDPTNPTVISSVTDPALNTANDIAIDGNTAYVTAYSNDSVVAVDITNPASMSVLGSVVDATNLGNPEGIVVSGSHVLVANDFSSGRFTSVDISTPASPIVADNLAVSGSACAGVALTGDGYAVSAAGQGLKMYAFDVSDPTAIVLVDELSDSRFNDAYVVGFQGDHAYVLEYLLGGTSNRYAALLVVEFV